MTTMTPILYSFRRCPYAMRARLAIASAGVKTELREIVLRDKPEAFLEASPSATVPCLVTAEGTIDESLDIMKWALAINDPDNWLDMPSGTSAARQQFARPRGGSEQSELAVSEKSAKSARQGWSGGSAQTKVSGWELIEKADGPFKDALDRTKYPSRYPGTDPDEHRQRAADFLAELDAQITTWIFAAPTIADFAILPFVRQFAFIDKDWFDAQAWPNLHQWLNRFLASDAFKQMMLKYPQWRPGEDVTLFP